MILFTRSLQSRFLPRECQVNRESGPPLETVGQFEAVEVEDRELTMLTARSIIWMSSATLISRMVRTVVMLVLAKLLVPSEFGLFGLATIATNAFGIFREMGLSQALIYHRREIDRAADTAFFLVPAQGFAMFVAAFALAPVIASFFNLPEASLLIRILSLDLIISSFGMVPSVLMERELSFRRKFIPLIAPFFGYSLVAIAAGFMGYGVWSLVAGELTRSLLTATVIWFFTGWRPRWSFDRRLARELLSYGKHIVGASFTVLAFTNIDNVAAAKGLGAEQLGFYVFAFSLGTMPITYLAQSVNRVLFPAYAKIQTDRRALAKAYGKSIEYMSLVAAPLALATVTLAPLALRVLYGNEWSGSLTVLQVLAFYGYFRAFGMGAESLLRSLGKPRLVSWITYLQLIVIVPLLYSVMKDDGIAGIGGLFTASIAIAAMSLTFLASKACGTSFLGVLSKLFYPLLFSCAGSAAAYAIVYHAMPKENFDALAAGSATFGIVYLVCLMGFRRRAIGELFRLIRVSVSSS